MGHFIPCQCCGSKYDDESWNWYVCDTCGYRICMNCYGKHSGAGNGHNQGGAKCSQCQTGWLHLQHGIRSQANPGKSTSKLDEYLNRARGNASSNSGQVETEDDFRSVEIESLGCINKGTSPETDTGIIITNSTLIAKKYKKTSANDVHSLIIDFIKKFSCICNYEWSLLDLGSDEMRGALRANSDWMDYAQLLADYADGMGIQKSPRTSIFIIGGSDVIPMPEFPASVGHDVKTVEDSDLLYCFPLDYPWKKVSINDAIFNVARIPLDYVEKGYIESTLSNDLGSYFNKVIKTMKDGGIPLKYAMMTANAGKNGNNDWTWTSADVMSKLPQQQLKKKDGLTRDNMFLCPSLDVMGEEHLSNEDVTYYKSKLKTTDMLFINLHGSPSKNMSGYLGSESYEAYYGMTTELLKQLNVPIINAFPCYGARYGRYFFDNNYDGSMPDYEVYDRDDSMLLTAFYYGNVLLFTGSCTSSMCSNVIGSGTVVDHLSHSNDAIDLLMPAGYAEAMLKLYACYLFQGEPAGYAMLKAKVDYLNYRAKYENKDLVFLTLNQFNLFGCPMLSCAPEDSTGMLRSTDMSLRIQPRELPDVAYKTEYRREGCGIDAVLHRAQNLVNKNLEEIDQRIRTRLYDALGISKDNLVTIESIEYNGQMTYNLTYSKQNKLFPEFYIVQTDENGDIKEVLQSR